MRVVLIAVLLAACSVAPAQLPEGADRMAATTVTTSGVPPSTVGEPAPTTPTRVEAIAAASAEAGFQSIKLALVGDVMLGRSVGPVVRADGESIFREVRHVLSSADVAAGNMESPLTVRPHISSNPYALEADPSVVDLLAQAGFDLMSIANNHAGDAGRASIIDSIDALGSVGILAIGGGPDASSALAPVIFDAGGLSIAFLAFDQSHAGTPATATAAGIAHWRAEVSPAAIRSVAATADVVVVSLHGGTEYSSTADRFFSEVVQSAVDAGATIVWGHGPHVVQAVEVVDSALVATSLGNFIFDQPFPGTYEGVILEVLVTGDGVAAFRMIRTEHRDKRVHLVGADPPVGAVAFISGEWWVLVRPIEVPTRSRIPVEGFPWGDVIDSDHGDLDGNGSVEAVVAFTRPYIPNPVTRLWSDHPWVDAEGQTTHVGVFGSDGYRKVWVAGSVPAPIEGLVVCGGTVGLDQRDGLVALRWSGFGFVPAQVLPGARAGGCGDVDGDGVLDLIATADREPVSSRRPGDVDGYSRAAEGDR